MSENMYHFTKIILLLLLINYACNGYKPTVEDYCKKNGKQNTVCKYKCARASRCGIIKERPYRDTTPAEREEALHIHNKLRNEMAGGSLAKYFLPPAKNMMVLSYDLECEFMAGCWLKQCTPPHDKNRNMADGTHAGQNYWGEWFKLNRHSQYLKLGRVNISRGPQAFYDEYKDLTKEEYAKPLYTKFRVPNTKNTVGHLTQLIWAETLYVGCAIMYRRTGNKFEYNFDVTCDYRPTGNVLDGKMYLIDGEQCPNSTKNDKYPNLCGKIRPMSEDKFIPPINLNGASSISINFILLSSLIILFRQF